MSGEIKKNLKLVYTTPYGLLAAAGVCVVGGGVLALVTRNPRLYAVGATLGAILVTAVIVIKLDADMVEKTTEPDPVPAPKPVPNRPESGVGAPMWAPGPRISTFNGLVTKAEAMSYPVAHRVPEVEFWTDELDDRTKWPNTSPLGPYTGDRGAGAYWP
jgi:hypothetical protein